MKKLKTLLIFLLFCGTAMLTFISSARAQISIDIAPRSEILNFSDQDVPKIVMPSLNMVAIKKEDIADEANGMPPRFGYPLEAVDLNLENAGQWTELSTGDRIWRLAIKCSGAKSINLLYEHFWLPVGATLHIYNSDRSHIIGAFSYRNNKGPRNGQNRFASSLVYGEKCILELFEPAAVKGESLLDIQKIVHGYRYIKLSGEDNPEVYNGSGSCQVDVHCSPEGNNWGTESESVAMILVGGTRWCSGSLLNTTHSDLTPYFLTADHCLTGSLDAAGDNDAWDWSFWWDYDRPAGSCNNSNAPEPTAGVTSGAILIANWAESDFALFRLIEDPFDGGNGPGGGVWFNGWNTTNSPSSGGVGIHHPSGDVMKISTHNLTPASSDYDGFANPNTHWEIDPWSVTANGQSVTEGGSSGSPLFMNNGQVIGQLHGGGLGNPNCSNPGADDAFYGKLGVSYDDNASIFRQLKYWIAPTCYNTFTVGFNLSSGARTYRASDWIVSAREVTDGGANIESYMTLYGGNYVELQNGFYVDGSSNFLADNKSCSSSAPPNFNGDSENGKAAYGINPDGSEWTDGIMALPNGNTPAPALTSADPIEGEIPEMKKVEIPPPTTQRNEDGSWKGIEQKVANAPTEKIGDNDAVSADPPPAVTNTTTIPANAPRDEDGEIISTKKAVVYPTAKIGDNDVKPKDAIPVQKVQQPQSKPGPGYMRGEDGAWIKIK